MIALDLDVAAFYRTARAAQFLQARSELLEFLCSKRQPVDHRNRLAAAAGNFAPDAYARALSGWRGVGPPGRHAIRRLDSRKVSQHNAAEGGSGFHA